MKFKFNQNKKLIIDGNQILYGLKDKIYDLSDDVIKELTDQKVGKAIANPKTRSKKVIKPEETKNVN